MLYIYACTLYVPISMCRLSPSFILIYIYINIFITTQSQVEYINYKPFSIGFNA